MAAHAIKHAVAKPGVEPEAVEDVYLGNGAHGAGNLARQAGAARRPADHHRRRRPINRFCSSGLQRIAMAANYIKQDGADVRRRPAASSRSPDPGRRQAARTSTRS